MRRVLTKLIALTVAASLSAASSPLPAWAGVVSVNAAGSGVGVPLGPAALGTEAPGSAPTLIWGDAAPASPQTALPEPAATLPGREAALPAPAIAAAIPQQTAVLPALSSVSPQEAPGLGAHASPLGPQIRPSGLPAAARGEAPGEGPQNEGSGSAPDSFSALKTLAVLPGAQFYSPLGAAMDGAKRFFAPGGDASEEGASSADGPEPQRPNGLERPAQPEDWGFVPSPDFYEFMGDLMRGDVVPVGGFPAEDQMPGNREDWEAWLKGALDTSAAAPAEEKPPRPYGPPAPSRLGRSKSLQRTFRFWTWVLSPLIFLLYNIRIHGAQSIPKDKGALIIANHVSYVDIFLLTLAAKRPIRFLMYDKYYRNPWLNWFVRDFQPIPVQSALEVLQDYIEKAREKARGRPADAESLAILDRAWTEAGSKGKRTREEFRQHLMGILEEARLAVPPGSESGELLAAIDQAYEAVEKDLGNLAVEKAIAEARAAIEAGDLVAVFPEGHLTPWGGLTEFKDGFTKIAEGLDAPVIPAFVDGLWGSFFSRKPFPHGWKIFNWVSLLAKYLRGMPRSVSIHFGGALPRFARPDPAAEDAVLQRKTYVQTAYREISVLGAAGMAERIRRLKKPLARAFLYAAKKSWWRIGVVDFTGMSLRYFMLLIASILLAGVLKPRLAAGGSNVGVLMPPSAGGVLANLAPSIQGKVLVDLNYTNSAEAAESVVSQAELGTIITSRKFLPLLETKYLETALLRALKVAGKEGLFEGLTKEFEQRADSVEERIALLTTALRDLGHPNPEGIFYWKKFSDRFVYLEDLKAKIPAWKKFLVTLAVLFLPAFVLEWMFFQHAASSVDELAAIIFTSGSSGIPKGAMHTHLSILSQVEALSDMYPAGPGDSMLGVLPFFHVFGYTVTFWLPLLTGITSVYHNHPRDIKGIIELVKRHKVSHLFGTPSFLQEYAEKDVPFFDLKLVISGAEALRPETLAAFKAKYGVEIRPGYGTTELAPVANVNPPDAPHFTGNRPTTVGPAIPGVAEMVVDPETFEVVPPGRSGLLLVFGPNVMQGYLKNPKKTEEVLRKGWYITGDIAVMDESGYVSIVGRLSRFSKINGEMVSHEDVERRLHAAANLAGQTFVVAGVPDARTGERLVVLTKKGFSGDLVAMLYDAYAKGMPSFWRLKPDSFYEVDDIPMLGSGKLDLKRLQELALELAGKR